MEVIAGNGAVDSALGKGLRILETLSRADAPVRLSSLASELSMQKSSVHRILRSLIELGFVAQDPDTDLYRATLRIWELGSAVVNALPIKQAATTTLQELHRRTAETVSLSVLDGDDVLYLDKIVARVPTGVTTRVGSRLPAPLTISGRALLAYEENAAEIILRVAQERGDRFDVDRALDDVRRVREDGYVISDDRLGRGMIGIAAAVPGAGGRAAAGLTVSALKSRLDAKGRKDAVEALLIAASGLSEAIGRY